MYDYRRLAAYSGTPLHFWGHPSCREGHSLFWHTLAFPTPPVAGPKITHHSLSYVLSSLAIHHCWRLVKRVPQPPPTLCEPRRYAFPNGQASEAGALAASDLLHAVLRCCKAGFWPSIRRNVMNGLPGGGRDPPQDPPTTTPRPLPFQLKFISVSWGSWGRPRGIFFGGFLRVRRHPPSLSPTFTSPPSRRLRRPPPAGTRIAFGGLPGGGGGALKHKSFGCFFFGGGPAPGSAKAHSGGMGRGGGFGGSPVG